MKVNVSLENFCQYMKLQTILHKYEIKHKKVFQKGLATEDAEVEFASYYMAEYLFLTAL